MLVRDDSATQNIKEQSRWRAPRRADDSSHIESNIAGLIAQPVSVSPRELTA